MSSTTPVAWQRLFYATLWKFSSYGCQDIIRCFNATPGHGSATCTYNTQDDIFEIVCLASDASSVSSSLLAIIDNYAEQDLESKGQVNDAEAEILSKVVKFDASIASSSFLGLSHVSSSESTGQVGGLELLKRPNIVDIHWTPRNPQIELKEIATPANLSAIEKLTACRLHLDREGRRVIITATENGGDVDAAMMKMTIIEKNYVSAEPESGPAHANLQKSLKPAIFHIIKIQKKHAFKLKFYNLEELGDGTLGRILLPEKTLFDSPSKLAAAYVCRYLKYERQEYVLQSRQTKPLTLAPDRSIIDLWKGFKFRHIGIAEPAWSVKAFNENPSPMLHALQTRQHDIELWVQNIPELGGNSSAEKENRPPGVLQAEFAKQESDFDLVPSVVPPAAASRSSVVRLFQHGLPHEERGELTDGGSLLISDKTTIGPAADGQTQPLRQPWGIRNSSNTSNITHDTQNGQVWSLPNSLHFTSSTARPNGTTTAGTIWGHFTELESHDRSKLRTERSHESGRIRAQQVKATSFRNVSYGTSRSAHSRADSRGYGRGSAGMPNGNSYGNPPNRAKDSQLGGYLVNAKTSALQGQNSQVANLIDIESSVDDTPQNDNPTSNFDLNWKHMSATALANSSGLQNITLDSHTPSKVDRTINVYSQRLPSQEAFGSTLIDLEPPVAIRRFEKRAAQLTTSDDTKSQLSTAVPFTDIFDMQLTHECVQHDNIDSLGQDSQSSSKGIITERIEQEDESEKRDIRYTTRHRKPAVLAVVGSKNDQRNTSLLPQAVASTISCKTNSHATLADTSAVVDCLEVETGEHAQQPLLLRTMAQMSPKKSSKKGKQAAAMQTSRKSMSAEASLKAMWVSENQDARQSEKRRKSANGDALVDKSNGLTVAAKSPAGSNCEQLQTIEEKMNGLDDVTPKSPSSKFVHGVRAALESAKSVKGNIIMEVQIGQIILQTVSRELRTRPFELGEFTAAMDQILDFDKSCDTFTNVMTTTSSDIVGMLELLSIETEEQPYKQSAVYEITCTQPDKSEVVLVIEALPETCMVDGTMAHVVKGAPILGAIYLHFPQRVWDARVLVKTQVCNDLDSQEGARELVDSLYVRTACGQSLPRVTGRYPDSLTVISVRIRSSLTYTIDTTGSSKFIRYTRMQELTIYQPPHPSPSERGVFMAGVDDAASLAGHNLEWYDVSLGILDEPAALKENIALELGSQVTWSAHDVFTDEDLISLESLTTHVVEKIDAVGFGNKGPAMQREAAAAQVRASEAQMQQTDSYW